MSYAVKLDYLQKLDLFASNLYKHVTVIKYESLTPDMFVLCFRTTGKDGQEHFFTLLEIDHIYTVKYAKKVIKDSFAPVIEFMPPVMKQKGRTEAEQKSVFDEKSRMFYLLARTKRPSGNGYWASYITVEPGDDIREKLKNVEPKERHLAKKTIVEVIKNNPDTSGASSFLEGWQARTKDLHKADDNFTTNSSPMAINVFKNSSGGWESFYNYTKKQK